MTAFWGRGLGGVLERTGSGGVGEGALAEGVCLLCSSVIIIGAFASEVTPSGSGVGADRTYHSNPPCNSNDNSIPVATLKRARVFR